MLYNVSSQTFAVSFFFFFFLVGLGFELNEGFTLAKQALNCLSHTSSSGSVILETWSNELFV
jgi:hypothetical protein